MFAVFLIISSVNALRVEVRDSRENMEEIFHGLSPSTDQTSYQRGREWTSNGYYTNLWSIDALTRKLGDLGKDADDDFLYGARAGIIEIEKRERARYDTKIDRDTDTTGNG